MTHFPDLSRYLYRGPAASEVPMLNVGWLSASHAFQTGHPSPDLVMALLTCCNLPVARCKGYHTCELCPPSTSMMTMELDGRPIRLGNGEIRVAGSDGSKDLAKRRRLPRCAGTSCLASAIVLE